MGSRISNSRKIPGPKIRELGGNTVLSLSMTPGPILHLLVHLFAPFLEQLSIC